MLTESSVASIFPRLFAVALSRGATRSRSPLEGFSAVLEIRPFRNFCRSSAFGLFLVVGAFYSVCTSWSALAGESTGPKLADTAKVLVLADGRVVTGKIHQDLEGFVVEKPEGPLRIRRDRVRLLARDLPDAYRQQRAAIQSPSASDHVVLGNWCLSNQLFDEARFEFGEALTLDPHNARARTTLRQLERVLGLEAQPTNQPATASPSRRSDVAIAQPESLGTLSRDVAREFVRSAQPILMNKCASASCHGPGADNPFRLTRIRAGHNAHRVFAERNLTATLRLIDFDVPSESPLLIPTKAPHGPEGLSVFRGTGGSEQAATLRRWVARIVRERATVVDSDRRSDAARQVLHRVGTQVRPPSHTLSTGLPDPVSIRHVVPAAASEDEPPAQTRNDAFDPGAFNRASGGSPR